MHKLHTQNGAALHQRLKKPITGYKERQINTEAVEIKHP